MVDPIIAPPSQSPSPTLTKTTPNAVGSTSLAAQQAAVQQQATAPTPVSAPAPVVTPAPKPAPSPAPKVMTYSRSYSSTEGLYFIVDQTGKKFSASEYGSGRAAENAAQKYIASLGSDAIAFGQSIGAKKADMSQEYRYHDPSDVHFYMPGGEGYQAGKAPTVSPKILQAIAETPKPAIVSGSEVSSIKDVVGQITAPSSHPMATLPAVTQPTQKIPLFDPVTGKPNIMFKDTGTPAPQPEVRYDKTYGLMIRSDLPSAQKRLTPETDVTGYYTYPIVQRTQELTKIVSENADKLVSLNERYNPLITPLRKSPVGAIITPAEQFGAGAIKGVGSLPEFFAVAGLGAETVVRQPRVAAPALVEGAVMTAEGLSKGIQEKPFETLGALVATKKVGDLTDIAIAKASSKVRDLIDIQTRPSIPPTERTMPVLEEIKGLKTREEALTDIKAQQFEQTFKPETPLGRTTELPGISGLKQLETRAEAKARIQAEEIRTAVKPEQPKIRYVKEAPAPYVPQSLKSLFGEVYKEPSIETRTLREIPSGGVVPENLKGLMTKEERLQQLKFETSSDIQKLRAGEPVKLYSGLPAEELQARYKAALEKGKRLRETFTGQEFKTGSKGYAPGEKPLSGLVSEYYTKHGTAEDLVSLEPKVKITPKPKPKVEVITTETEWEAQMRRAGSEAYRDLPTSISGVVKEEPVPMLKPKLAEPKVKPKAVSVVERPKPTVKTLYTKEELGIVEKPKVEVKPTEKVFVKKDIMGELRERWAERNLALSSLGVAQVTRQGQVLVTKPEKVEKVKPVVETRVIDLTSIVPTTDISTFTAVKTVPAEKTRTVTTIKPAIKPVTKPVVRPIVEPIVKPIVKPIPKPELVQQFKFPRNYMDIFLTPYTGELEVIRYPEEKKDEGERKPRKPKIKVTEREIRHKVSEIPDFWLVGKPISPVVSTKPKVEIPKKKGKKSRRVKKFWEP